MNKELCISNSEEILNPIKSFHMDLEILDRYQKFSEEILRVSILIIGVVGYLLSMEGFKQNLNNVKYYIFIGLCFLGISSILSLLHRYFSTDSIANHLEFLRKDSSNLKILRDKGFKLSTKLIYYSVISLVFGVLFIIVAFIYFIESKN